MKRFFGIMIAVALGMMIGISAYACTEQETCTDATRVIHESHYDVNPEELGYTFTNVWEGSTIEYSLMSQDDWANFFNYNGLSYEELGEIAEGIQGPFYTCTYCWYSLNSAIFKIGENYYLVVVHN